MRVFCLSVHASYRCGHSGACCTSGWPIPVETRLRQRLDDALAAGQLEIQRTGKPFVDEGEAPPGARGILRTDARGACWFHDREAGRCSIHSQLGHGALPVSCQHFPRVCLLDREGAFVKLSHYCPTAADLLFRHDGPLEVVPAAPQFATMTLEGLDARDALPPLLHPGMLMDRESYRAWESTVVAFLAAEGTAERALERAVVFTEALRGWQPSRGPLAGAVGRAAHAERSGGRGDLPLGQTSLRALGALRPVVERRVSPAALSLDRLVRQSVPAGLAPPGQPADADGLFTNLAGPAWPAFVAAVARYLAAHAFANWCAYQGRGLRTVLCSVVAALCVLKVEAARQCAEAGRPLDRELLTRAFRSADLLLVHLASREELASALGAVEETGAEAMIETLR